MLRATFCALALSATCFVGTASAELAAPTGDVVLTVVGKVTETNGGDGVVFLDRALLEAMPSATIDTSTIWTQGKHSFEGVSLATLVDQLGIKASNLRAIAINDYAVDIPITDAVEGGAIIAYRIDGKEMSIREKGPLWVIYPYDDNADYRKEVIYSRSIWQLDRIEALD